MANQPSLIPSAWAANNSTTETIPATTSETGKASWDQGFPVETSLPLSEGGIPPKYGDFNGILNVLSQFCLFAQAGGQFTWSSTLSYSVGSIVVGSDGSIYRAVQATTNVNPVGDTSGKWERIVSKSDIDALESDIQTAMTNAANAVANASAAQSAVTTLNANVVKLSGNQTVGGTKTFTSGFHGNTSELRVQNDKTNNDGFSSIYGGAGYTTGGYVSVYGIAHASYPGQFRCNATTGSVVKALIGKPDGTLTWDGQPVQTTSDERLKTPMMDVPDEVLDAWGAVGWGQFQYLDAVAEKGAGKARLHLGLIAQRVKAVFEERGLNACKYGILCHEERPATKDEQADDLWMVRYTEAAAMEAAYQRRRADRAEARISALEQRLAEMEAVLASLISPVGDETYAEPEQEQDAEQEGEE